MKKTILFLISINCCIALVAQKEKVLTSDTLFIVRHFSFHNNMWMNMHHFFYEQASNRQKKHLEEDGEKFVNIGDSLKIVNLSKTEKKLFNDGIQFYKKNIIDQALINSGLIFKWLQAQPVQSHITDTTYSQEFTEILNRLSALYKTCFWQIHKEQNQKLLNNYTSLIESTEDFVIGKMETLSGSNWKGIVRIDLTTYGNWASAYSPDIDNIVVSSIDPMLNSTLFIEFVYHESSHLLFSRSSPFRRILFETSKKLEIDYPRNLWHAAMFYLSGLATKEALNGKDIDHELIMNKKNVFKNYYSDPFRVILINYYNGDTDTDEMALKLLQLNISE